MNESDAGLYLLYKEAEKRAEEGHLQEAAELFRSLLEKAPGYAPAWHQLGVIAQKCHDLEGAIQCLRRACAFNRDGARQALYVVYLASLYEKAHRPQEALQCYHLALQARVPLALERVYNKMAALLASEGKSEEAKNLYIKSLEINPYCEDTYCSISELLKTCGMAEEAIRMARRALVISPGFVRTRIQLAQLLSNQGLSEEAQQEYQNAWNEDPSALAALWGSLLNLPVIYKSTEELVQKREQWKKNLVSLDSQITCDTPEAIEKARQALLLHVNFFLAYTGGNVLEEQRAYASLVSKITKAAYPFLTHPLQRSPRTQGHKIRVGFVSRNLLYFHSVYRTHGRWVTQLPRDRFEVHAFLLRHRDDEALAAIRARADSVFQGESDPEEIAFALRKKELDVLIFPDIGMDSTTWLLASLQLAPIQCTALGHPITTGLPTVDYFLSSELMEPPDAEKQYSEKLILLPNLSSSYPYPDLTGLSPVSGSKKQGRILYVIAQSLFKLLPQRDHLYPQIALQVPSCEFHFIAKTHAMGVLFHERLKRAFASYNLNADDYCTLHPWMKRDDFLNWLQSADVCLDSMDWSGFNTTMDAIALDLPVVTLPGLTCRSRHSMAILNRIHLEELVAKDEADYVGLATRLGVDASFRKAMTEKIKSNKRLAFDDIQAIEGLASFLQEIV